MQNVDFYQNRSLKRNSSSWGKEKKTFLPQQTKLRLQEEDNIFKSATHLIFIIIALCIISFTTGLALGIKFAGGSQKEIIDQKTYQAVTETVSSLGSKVSTFIDSSKELTGPLPTAENQAQAEAFPTQEYPYVIKVGKTYDQSASQKVADFLSEKGHRVIISKKEDKYRVFAGPFRDQAQAKISLKELSTYKNFLIAHNSKILKR